MSNPHKAAFSVTKILLPIDFSPLSEAVLEAATALATQFHAGIHLVHIIPEPPALTGSDFYPVTEWLQEHRETIEQKLRACEEQLRLKGVQTSFSVETGNDIVANLMHVIQREQADLIVISTHGLSGWRPFILGSIAEHLIKHADCTLLLIKPTQKDSAIAGPAIAIEANSVVAHAPETEHLTPAVPETLAQRRLDRSADDLAGRAGKTEQHYDQSHSLITK